MLGYVYNSSHSLSSNQDLGVKVATPIGTFIGQLLFGWLADVVGRKRMCEFYILKLNFISQFGDLTNTNKHLLLFLADGIELMIIIVGCFGQVLSGEANAVNIIAVIIVWRGIVSSIFRNTHIVRLRTCLTVLSFRWG